MGFDTLKRHLGADEPSAVATRYHDVYSYRPLTDGTCPSKVNDITAQH